ncbi:hypothetical protein [Paenibacillus spongiae]|uniref:Uncharacterized protein n=1 Tax=Paenibacillus spongiae TaxID=2909671 RepID=A0ABY5S6N1_9BACL|nr:hypothetical protein [Paenibacillus spongiae]UVI29566.1 hypothetical protein L1F29_29815 [Paenibacillus spongiae]
MKRYAKLTWAGAVLLLLIAAAGVFIYNSKSYYPPLPIGMEGISKKEVLRAVHDSRSGLNPVLADEKSEWLGFHGNQGDGGKHLIAEMEHRGWGFTEQLGAGYLFQDAEGRQRIVESEMWTSNYVIYQVFHEGKQR